MIRRVLVALDASPRAPGVMAAAIDLARSFGATIVPFRAVQVPPEFPPAAHVEGSDPLVAFLEREALLQILPLLEHVDVAWETPLIAHGQPWRTILETAEAENVDLIVIGSHGYHGVDRVLGTTAGKVVNLARCSVLVVHERVAPKENGALPPDPNGET